MADGYSIHQCQHTSTDIFLLLQVLQTFVSDLHDKMTGVSLYGVVRDIFRENNTAESIFCLRIEDSTGAICTKLHFAKSWYYKCLLLDGFLTFFLHTS